jgi:hypothetical protein
MADNEVALPDGYSLRLTPVSADGRTVMVDPLAATETPTLAEQLGYLGAGGIAGWQLSFLAPDGDETPVPVELRRLSIRGVPLAVLCLAGYDLFDYLSCGAIGLPEHVAVAGLRNSALRLGAHGIFLQHLHGVVPPDFGRFAHPFRNRVFDVDVAERGWLALTNKESLKRHTNRARRTLDYRVEHRNADCDDALLEEIARLHVERWAFDGHASALADVRRLDQYRVSRRRWIVTVIRDGETLMAAHVGFRFGGTLWWHTPAINIRYLDWSPLQILLRETALECQRLGIRRLDFGLGDEPYKDRFANAEHPVWNWFIPASPRAWLAHRLLGMTRLKGGLARCRRWWEGLRSRSGSGETTVAFPAAVVDNRPDPRGAELVEAGDFATLVDLFRRSGIQVRRDEYDRLRSGQHFIGWRRDQTLLAYAWRTELNGPVIVSCRWLTDSPADAAAFVYAVSDANSRPAVSGSAGK